MKRARLLAILSVFSITTAAAQYSNPFDPWRACNKFCPAAAKGDPIALHTCFLAAYVRKSDPYLGAHDLEEMFSCMERLLKELGDPVFSEALALERPEVVSAVGGFLQAQQLRKTPKTRRLLDKAPNINFPLDQSNRDETQSPLLQRFMRYEKEHPDR